MHASRAIPLGGIVLRPARLLKTSFQRRACLGLECRLGFVGESAPFGGELIGQDILFLMRWRVDGTSLSLRLPKGVSCESDLTESVAPHGVDTHFHQHN